MRRFSVALSAIVCLAVFLVGNAAEIMPLPAGKPKTRGSSTAVYGRDGSLTVTISRPHGNPDIRLFAPEGHKYWDMSRGQYFAVDVTNLSRERQARLFLLLRTEVPGNKGHLNAGIALNPGETRTLRVALPHQWKYATPEKIPGQRTIDTARIVSIDFNMKGWYEPTVPQLIHCRLSDFRLEGKLIPAENVSPVHMKNFYPFVDLYGQYAHSDWPEKIHSDTDLKKEFAREKAELDASRRPMEWNEYGGWKNGPKLAATGNFRVEKYRGKWFFVDPSGCLFFSHGLDVLIKHTDPVKIDGHEHWFPAEIGKWTFPHRGATCWQTTDRSLQVKYGRKDYDGDFYRTLSKRLEYWGFNSVGDWGSPELMALGTTPYTLQLTDFDWSMPRIGRKFYDVYDPVYQNKMRNLFKIAAERNPQVSKSINDPMCIGYFIDNELNFGNRSNFAFLSDVMSAPAEKAVKRAFAAAVKKRYASIDALNKSWGTDYADWDALLKSTAVPKKSRGLRIDMEKFFMQTVELYFRMCRDAVKSAAPNRLYLGCRFVNLDATHAGVVVPCAKYADVISANVYGHTPANFRIEGMPDRPVLIGEFQFSTSLPGRGRFAPNIVAGSTEQERATVYLRYLQGALLHPNIIGAHWFQFRDQPLTGRSDGEGFQTGFVDIADTPYRELTKMSREIGENMYRFRMNGKYSDGMKTDGEEDKSYQNEADYGESHTTASFAAAPINLALGAEVSASSEDGKDPGAMRAEKAVDGDWNSRWSSGTKARTAWFLLDLGEPKEICEIKLQWEYAGAKEYSILFSEDGKEFTEVAVKKNGRAEEAIRFFIKPRKARFVKLDCRKRVTSFGYSLYEIELYDRSSNLAADAGVTASSEDRAPYAAVYAADGARSTRWSSVPRDGQWLQLELPEEREIARIVLDWERAAAEDFSISLSQDGRHFQEVFREKDGAAGRQTVSIKPQKARFVRIDCRKRLTSYGFSLYEVELYGRQY